MNSAQAHPTTTANGNVCATSDFQENLKVANYEIVQDKSQPDIQGSQCSQGGEAVLDLGGGGLSLTRQHTIQLDVPEGSDPLSDTLAGVVPSSPKATKADSDNDVVADTPEVVKDSPVAPNAPNRDNNSTHVSSAPKVNRMASLANIEVEPTDDCEFFDQGPHYGEPPTDSDDESEAEKELDNEPKSEPEPEEAPPTLGRREFSFAQMEKAADEEDKEAEEAKEVEEPNQMPVGATGDALTAHDILTKDGWEESKSEPGLFTRNNTTPTPRAVTRGSKRGIEDVATAE